MDQGQEVAKLDRQASVRFGTVEDSEEMTPRAIGTKSEELKPSRSAQTIQQRQSSVRISASKRCMSTKAATLGGMSTRALSHRQISIVSILTGGGASTTDGTVEEAMSFLMGPAPTAELPYSKVPVPASVMKKLVVLFYVLQLAGSLLFLRWLTTDGWNHASPATSAIFLWTEVIAFISTNFFLFNGLLGAMKNKTKKKALKDSSERDSTEHMATPETDADVEEKGTSSDNIPTVAVCVCRYKEPVEDLIMTVHCMDRIHWPRDKLQLFILDDGWHVRDETYQQEQATMLADILGVIDDQPNLQPTAELHRPDCATECSYWKIREASRSNAAATLLARKKPDVSHYKAGNLNNFLFNYLGDAAQRGEAVPKYMVMLDHDMLPHQDFVRDAVTRLQEDPNKAFVQYPQRFYDIIGSDLLYAGNEIFFDGVQINRSQVGLTAFAGTNALWNLQSLYHVGGFQYGSLTEDANTGLAVNIAGYTSEYSLREMAVGQSPQTVEDAMQQRMRWSQGSVEMLVHHVKSLLTCKSPFTAVELPKDLAASFTSPAPKAPGLRKKMIMGVIFLDSMVYPLYSMGFLLHVVVCVMYLYNAEAPIAPADPTQVLYYWLPLYIIKAICQVLAFPGVSLSTQWNSQMAWAGYSFSTLASIRKGLFAGGGWFNTGAAKKDRFWLQYGNTFVAVAIYVMILYRAVAFIVIDKTCTAWMTAGSLLYGMVMMAHVRNWAVEPFRRSGRADDDEDPSLALLRDTVQSQSRLNDAKPVQLQERALQQSRRNRDDHQSLDLSLVFILLHVILLSFLLFFWASGNCDSDSKEAQIQAPVAAVSGAYCSFISCSGVAQGGTLCNVDKEGCIGCGGEWCENEKVQFQPVGIATTTRYWDCSGGSCGCGFGDTATGAPVHCHSNAMFEAPQGNEYGAVFYGAAAVSAVLGGGEWLSVGCGKCWKLTGTSNTVASGSSGFNSTVVLKATNYCPPTNAKCDGAAHFDIAVPGHDHASTSLANTCAEREPEEIEGFEACSVTDGFDDFTGCDCTKFRDPVLRAGCQNFLWLGWINPTVDYEEVTCPPQLAQLPCWEENDEEWAEDGPGLCADPLFV